MGVYYILDPHQAVIAPNPQAWLGRIVKNRDCPIEGYTPRGTGSCAVLEIEDSTFLDYAQLQERNATQGYKLAVLGDILSTSFERTSSNGQSIKAKQLQRLRLHQDDEVFLEVRSQAEVVSDIENWRISIRRPLYFIVGLLVGTDVVRGTTALKSNNTALSIDPLQIAGLASGVPLPIGSSVGGQRGTGQYNAVDTVLQGQRIVAIEYRVVKMRGIHRDPNKLRLAPIKHKGDSTFGDDMDDEPTGLPPQIIVELGSETLEEYLEDEEAQENEESLDADPGGMDHEALKHGLDRCINVDI